MRHQLDAAVRGVQVHDHILGTLSCYLTPPVLVTALCPLLFHEKMTRAQFVCFLMSRSASRHHRLRRRTGAAGQDIARHSLRREAPRCFMPPSSCSTNTSPASRRSSAHVRAVSRAAILVLTPYVALTSELSPGRDVPTGWVNLLIVGLVHTGLTCHIFSPPSGRCRAGVAAELISTPSCPCRRLPGEPLPVCRSSASCCFWLCHQTSPRTERAHG